MKKRGAYKVSHIRIIDDEPKVDYDELARLQAQYTISEIEYQMKKLTAKMAELRKKLRSLQTHK